MDTGTKGEKKQKNARRNENETYNGTSIWGPYLSDPKKNANRAKNRVLKPLSLDKQSFGLPSNRIIRSRYRYKGPSDWTT